MAADRAAAGSRTAGSRTAAAAGPSAPRPPAKRKRSARYPVLPQPLPPPPPRSERQLDLSADVLEAAKCLLMISESQSQPPSLASSLSGEDGVVRCSPSFPPPPASGSSSDSIENVAEPASTSTTPPVPVLAPATPPVSNDESESGLTQEPLALALPFAAPESLPVAATSLVPVTVAVPLRTLPPAPVPSQEQDPAAAATVLPQVKDPAPANVSESALALVPLTLAFAAPESVLVAATSSVSLTVTVPLSTVAPAPVSSQAQAPAPVPSISSQVRNPASASFTCARCGKGFQTYQALGGHMTCHRKTPNGSASVEDGQAARADAAGPAASGGGTHQCKTCHRTFSTGQALGGHMRLHYTGVIGAGKSVPVYSSVASAASKTDTPSSSVQPTNRNFDLNVSPVPADVDGHPQPFSPTPATREYEEPKTAAPAHEDGASSPPAPSSKRPRLEFGGPPVQYDFYQFF